MARVQISQNERLLLHLLEMDDHREESEVPLGASQEGIAQRLGIQIHSASRALSALESEGLVSDRLARVRGAAKRRRAYFLTDKGHKEALRTKEALTSTKVIYEEKGKAEEMTLGESLRRFHAHTGHSPPFLDFVSLGKEAEVIRYDILARHLVPSDVRERYNEASSGRPTVTEFFGRDEERLVISGFLDGGASVMLIWGIPGIGKTSLASKAFDQLSGRRHLFWYSFHTWDTEEHFLAVLAKFLESVGRNAVAKAVARRAGTRDLFAPLLSDLSSLKAVLFLDDVQKASGKLTLALTILLDAVRASESCKSVLMSREMPPYFPKTAEDSVVIELAGLDDASARLMAESRRARDPASAVDASRGHPLLLSLMCRSGIEGSRGDVVSFIDREVSLSLSPEERDAIELLSVFRHPVPPEAIISDRDEPLVSLKDKGLVLEQEQGIWTHDVLREFFVSRLSPASRSRLHAMAARYCETRSGADWRLESLHHHVQAGDREASVRVAVDGSQELVQEFPHETLSLLSQVMGPREPQAGSAGLLMLMGQLSEVIGDDSSAADYYDACLGLLQADEESAERAIVLEAIGKLKTRVERWTESFAAHQKALEIYVKKDDKAGQIREWLNIAGAHRRRAHFQEAREAYSKAMSIASSAEDRSAQGACLNNLAMLDWDEGRLRDAEARLKESVRLSHAVKNHAGEARALENLAALLGAQTRTPEMTELLMESAEAFRRSGEVEEYKRMIAGCAESLGLQGKAEEGVALCRNAVANPEVSRRPRFLNRSPGFDKGDAALALTLVGLLRRSGDLKSAEAEVNRLYSIAKSLDDPVLKAKAKVELALVKESSGDLEGAVGYLAEAEDIVRAAGDKRGLIAVHMMMGNLEEKKGDYEAARERYKEAAMQAELVGDGAAMGAASKNLAALGSPEG